MSLLYTFLLGASFALAQLLIGGTRLLFSLPVTALVALTAVLSVASLRRRKVAPDAACVFSAVAFAGYVMGRAVISPVAYLAWPDLFSAGTALAVYLLVACCLTDPSRRLGLLGVLLAMVAVHLWAGARQFTGEDRFMLLQWRGTVLDFIRPPNYFGRASGLYICPNHLAGYLEVVGSLALAAALWSRVRVSLKILLGYAGLMCFAGLVLTLSRGGFLSGLAALLVLVVGSLWRARATVPMAFGRVLLGAALALALGAGAVGGVMLKNRVVRSRVAGVLDTGDVRVKLWGPALRQFQSDPMLGTGSGTYLFYGRQFRDPTMQRDPVRVHNDYLELLAEYGAVGAVALLCFLAAHLRAGVRDFRALLASGRDGAVSGPGLLGSNAAALNLGALAALASFLVHSALDFNLHVPVNAMLLAFVCALLANPGRALLPTAASREGPRWWEWIPRVALPLLGVGLLAGGLPRLPGELWSERARVALRDGQNLEAVRLARAGLGVESRNPTLYFYLGEARFLIGQASERPAVARSFYLSAVEAFEQGRRLFPQDVRLLVREGLALSLLEQHAEAETRLRGAVAWDPNSGFTRAALAFGLQRAGRLEDAEAEYQRAVALVRDPQIVAGLDQVRRARAVLGAGGAGRGG